LYLLPQPRKKAGKIYNYYSIAESYREAGKSRIRIIWRLGHLTDLKAHQIQQVIKIIQSKEDVVFSLEDVIFSKHWHYLDVSVLNHQWESWSLSDIFARKMGTLKIAKILTFNRCLDPGSKLYASRWVRRTTLNHILKINYSQVNDDKIYRELIHIEDKKEKLERHIFNKIKARDSNSPNLIFYDLTTSHFEGSKCLLARPGRTKSHGFKPHRIVLSLIVNEDGIPFFWEVLPGDTTEVSTIKNKIAECKARFGIENVTLVFDRGMVSEKNLSLIEEEELNYISALDKDQIPSVKDLDLAIFKGDDHDQIVKNIKEHGFEKFDDELYFKEIERETRRYVIGFNPVLFEDEREARQRRLNDLLDFVKKKNQALNTARKNVNKDSLRRLMDKKLKGLSRLCRYRIEPETHKVYKGQDKGPQEIKSFKIILEIKKEKLEKAKLTDGLCCFITNHKKKEKGLYTYPTRRIVASYRDKDKVEQAFRNIKSFVKFSPVYVFKEKHVRAHYTICILSYLLNISIVNQVKEVSISSFKSSDHIYEELSDCILAEFKASPGGKPVKKINNLTVDQKNILRSLKCEYLATCKYVKNFIKS
jgi:transposase